MELFIGGAIGVLVVMLVIGIGVLFMRDRIAPIDESSQSSDNK